MGILGSQELFNFGQADYLHTTYIGNSLAKKLLVTNSIGSICYTIYVCSYKQFQLSSYIHACINETQFSSKSTRFNPYFGKHKYKKHISSGWFT